MKRLILLFLPLFLLSLLPPSSAGSSIYSFQATYTVTNTGSSEVDGWVEAFAFSSENFGWNFQEVLEENFFPLPQDFRGVDNRILRFSLGKLAPGVSREARLTQLVRVRSVRVENLKGGEVIPPELLRLTEPVPHLWENAPELLEKAQELRGETHYLTARNIFDFVKDHLTYFAQATNQSALEVYRSRVGKCTEFTNLFIALARLSGLPAKFLAGYGYNPQFGENAERMGHAFAALYLPGSGWVPVDEVWQGGQFGELSEDHLLLFSSDGSNLVRSGEVSIPGERWSGGMRMEKIILLRREAAVEVKLEGKERENGGVNLLVTVSNGGRSRLENLRLNLFTQENVFAPFSRVKELESLAPGASEVLVFSLQPVRSVENLPVEVEVRAWSAYGEVSSEGSLRFTVIILPAGEPSFQVVWFLPPVLVVLLLLVILKLRH